MQLRSLGNCGLAVSPIGFGTFKIGRNEKIKYPSAYELPDDAAVMRLLDGLAELGICHFDTAPAYGLAEERLGRWLQRTQTECVVSTKVGERFSAGESSYRFDAQSIRQSLETSRRLLHRDVLDIVLIHTPADDVRVLTSSDAVETLLQLRSKGEVRAIGLSGKTVQAATMALDWADVLMVEFNPADLSHAEVIQAAHSRGIGVLVKKGLASGNLPPAEAIPQVLNHPGVSNLVVGGLNLEHMAENVRLATQSAARSESQ